MPVRCWNAPCTIARVELKRACAVQEQEETAKGYVRAQEAAIERAFFHLSSVILLYQGIHREATV